MHDAILHLELPAGAAAGMPGAALPAFVVGPENRLLAPAIQRLLDGNDLAAVATLFNPLTLVGPSGSGKSHLVQGLVRRWRGVINDHEVAYFTAADLGRELHAAHAEERAPQWRRELANLRLLVVEGLERFRRGGAAQRELRQASDAILDQGGLLVATADREPATLTNLDAGLRDRLAAGLTLRLAPPAVEARRALLTLAANSRGISLPDDRLTMLAEAEIGAAAQLFDRLDAASPGRDKSAAVDATGDPITFKQILTVTARYFAVTQAALISHSRRKSLVAARNATVYLARRLTRLSYGEIGRCLGGRDHTTIMHAEHRLSEGLATDPVTRQAVDELERILRC
jgi:chromosomal replication initiator protein